MGTNPQKTADLVPFTEEILNEKLHFLCSASSYIFDWTPNTPLQMFQEKKKNSGNSSNFLYA